MLTHSHHRTVRKLIEAETGLTVIPRSKGAPRTKFFVHTDTLMEAFRLLRRVRGNAGIIRHCMTHPHCLVVIPAETAQLHFEVLPSITAA